MGNYIFPARCRHDAGFAHYRATDPYSWDMPESERRQARLDYERRSDEPDADDDVGGCKRIAPGGGE